MALDRNGQIPKHAGAQIGDDPGPRHHIHMIDFEMITDEIQHWNLDATVDAGDRGSESFGLLGFRHGRIN